MEAPELYNLNRPMSPKKNRKDVAPPSADQDRANQTPYRYGEQPGKLLGRTLRPVQQRVHMCQCCACELTEDITLDSVTCSYGHPVCSFCKDQLRSHEAQSKDADEPSEEIPQLSANETSDENANGSENDDRCSHKAQVGYETDDDSFTASKEDTDESSEDNAPLEGVDESSRGDEIDLTWQLGQLGQISISYVDHLDDPDGPIPAT